MKSLTFNEIHMFCYCLAKDKMNAAMKEFIDYPIHEDREMPYFAVL
jgi:hypothetical protein